MSKRKQAGKPAKRSKPLTARKKVEANNKAMTDHFIRMTQQTNKKMAELEQAVGQSNQQLWQNQQMQSTGLSAAEDHVMMIRRVLNDAISGTTRVKKVERRSHDDPNETENAQVIDWLWYGEQLHYQRQDKEAKDRFMEGHILTEGELEVEKVKEKIEMDRQKVAMVATECAQKDEDKLQELYDSDRKELLTWMKENVKKGVEWDDEMDQHVPEIVKMVLVTRKKEREHQAMMERKKAESIISSVADAVVKEFDLTPDYIDEWMRDHDEDVANILKKKLPPMVEWKPWMEVEAPVIVRDAAKRAEEKAEAQAKEREEMEEAAQELMDETKEFAEEAGEVIKLIEAGNQAAAKKAMAELDKKVKAKEAQNENVEPVIPEGAAVFGG